MSSYIIRIDGTVQTQRKEEEFLWLKIVCTSSHVISLHNDFTVSFCELVCFCLPGVYSQLEKLIEKNHYLHKSAREAYRSYLQAYASHQHKSIFNVNALDLQRVAPAFGFVVPPRVNLSILLSPSKLSLTYPSRPLLFNSGEVSVLGQ